MVRKKFYCQEDRRPCKFRKGYNRNVKEATLQIKCCDCEGRMLTKEAMVANHNEKVLGSKYYKLGEGAEIEKQTN